MDLKTFVSQTLIQIVEGVNDAKQHIEGLGIGAAVNPETTYSSGPPHAAPSDVEFDVAVTVATSDRDKDAHNIEGAAGGVLAVVSLRAKAQTGGEAIHEQREEAVSRVKFSVKLGQPGKVERKPSQSIPSMRPGFHG
ncbi:hypothetical protein [Sphingomonas aerophila]|uniref:Uncharacterized protein n=1 Tax=Sphingomonas aerophila TaxID=1344948 RepID=A0A7W9BGJ0_9SPHN|nr:hypothetical protein [Sphingomonas aerophila]MBB5716456.1 hypothetical protein [Sphingomonas aerophila]